MKDQTTRQTKIKKEKKTFPAIIARKKLFVMGWFITPILFFSIMSTLGSPGIIILDPSFNSSSLDIHPETNCTACHTVAISASSCEYCHNSTFAPLPSTVLNETVSFDHHNTTHPIQGQNVPECDDPDCHGSSSDYRHVDRPEVNMTEYCGICHAFPPGQCDKCHTTQPTAKKANERGTRPITSVSLAFITLLTTFGVIILTNLIFKA